MAAGKRNACNDLNHENWDEDDEREEAGTFERASDEVLRNRVIKTARRRNVATTSEAKVKNVFSGFDGFKKTDPVDTKSPITFPFVSNVEKSSEIQNNSNGFNSPIARSSPINPLSNSHVAVSNSSLKFDDKTDNSNENTDSDEKLNSYYSKLKALNESLVQWIQLHVQKNSCIILTPIFKDYERHLTEIEKIRKLDSESDQKEKAQFMFTTRADDSSIQNSPTISGNKMITESKSIFEINSTKQSTFLPPVQESKEEFKTNISPGSFLFSSNSTKLPTTEFSIGGGTPFKFTNVSKPESTVDSKLQENQEDSEDANPKVEFAPIVEEGSVFQQRCKVFVKKDDQFVELDVGQLFLKPVEGSEKTQLIVRADTSLGKVLLNLILNSSIPIQKMGKNNVMLVAVPNQESTPPPVPILLRVKTAEEADVLLKVLEKHKK